MFSESSVATEPARYRKVCCYRGDAAPSRPLASRFPDVNYRRRVYDSGRVPFRTTASARSTLSRALQILFELISRNLRSRGRRSALLTSSHPVNRAVYRLAHEVGERQTDRAAL